MVDNMSRKKLQHFENAQFFPSTLCDLCSKWSLVDIAFTASSIRLRDGRNRIAKKSKLNADTG
jgi:hypothetical protein